MCSNWVLFFRYNIYFVRHTEWRYLNCNWQFRVDFILYHMDVSIQKIFRYFKWQGIESSPNQASAVRLFLYNIPNYMISWSAQCRVELRLVKMSARTRCPMCLRRARSLTQLGIQCAGGALNNWLCTKKFSMMKRLHLSQTRTNE